MNIYHWFRKKSLYQRRIIPAGIILIYITVGPFFVKQFLVTKPKIVPMPTALDPSFTEQLINCFIPTAAIYGYTLRTTSGFRSLTDQAEIYNSGRTVDGNIVTWAEPGRSMHNYGFAIDIVDRWRGYNIDFDKLAKIGAYCGLEQVDPPHFEYRDGLTTHQLEAGMRPSPFVLPCGIMAERAKAHQKLTLEDLKNNNCRLPKF